MVAKFLALALLPLIVLAEGELQHADGEGKLGTLNDIIISGNTVGGDINVHGHGGGKGHGNGGDPTEPVEGGQGGEGEEVFDDGCSVVGQTVHECDGSQRLMTATEKRRMAVRASRKQMKKRNMKGRQNAKKPLRKARNQKTRRDMDEESGAGGEEPSPCQTCATGAMKKRQNKRH